MGQFSPLSIREGVVSVLLEELLVPYHLRRGLALARNVPQGIVIQEIERSDICPKFGWCILPTGRSTDLKGTEHNVVKRLMDCLSNALQTQVHVLR